MTQKACLMMLLGLFAPHVVAGAETRTARPPGPAAVTRVALTAEAWDFAPNAVASLDHRAQRAMKVQAGAPPVTLKRLDFRDGAIEFDLELLDPRFVNFYFRWKSAAETESFYFRTARAGSPLVRPPSRRRGERPADWRRQRLLRLGPRGPTRQPGRDRARRLGNLMPPGLSQDAVSSPRHA